ncbi:MAG: F0F1 ATP synthase subunit B [Actinobacteria bacterium]|nr:F0F1 ATP synthase subunit B [Actinomycetota bacterium]
MHGVLALVVASEEAEVTAKNPILPETKEIVWAVVAFVLVFSLLAWKAWPAIKKALRDREDKIRGDLERAEAVRSEAEASLEEYNQQLAEARGEAGRIIEEARVAADQVRKDLIARAEADAADVRTRAQEDIRLASDRAIADLQTRVSDLSIELAERIVQRNLDRDTQIALIESYINEVGGTRR